MNYCECNKCCKCCVYPEKIVTHECLGKVIPIKYTGYKKECCFFKFGKLHKTISTLEIKEMLCPSGKKYTFFLDRTKMIQVRDAEFLLRFKDGTENYCFEVDM